MPVRIGTSGWQYPHWRGRFYPRGLPASRWLEHYAGRFATVEINATFYGLPRPDRFGLWAAATPDDFVFAVKASRYLTHVRRLRDPGPAAERLLEGAMRLGPKLGPILLQLPPTMRADADALAGALACFPAGVRVAVEFRHPSWFDGAIRQVLEAHGAALCLADTRYRRSPLWVTADWTYLRLHAGLARPLPCYGARTLSWWAGHLAGLAGPDADAYVYFNNDGRCCAPRDAALFADACRRAGLLPSRVPDPGTITPG